MSNLYWEEREGCVEGKVAKMMMRSVGGGDRPMGKK